MLRVWVSPHPVWLPQQRRCWENQKVLGQANLFNRPPHKLFILSEKVPFNFLGGYYRIGRLR